MARQLHTKSITAGVLAALCVLALLWGMGMRPVRLEMTTTGDAQLAHGLREWASQGHHELTAFVIDGDRVTFAGLGADHNTEVEIGSVTKTFNGELLRLQVERGELTPETTVREILTKVANPPLDLQSLPIDLQSVTVAELADHTAGVPRLVGVSFWDNYKSNPYAGIDLEEFWQATSAVVIKERGSYAYSNYGHALLGQLLALNVGLNYGELLQRDLLRPIGMNSTWLATPGTVAAAAPRGLGGNGQETSQWEFDAYAPAGALRSTAKDMELFARYLMDNSEFTYAWPGEDDGTYGHEGGTGGYSTTLLVEPATQNAIWVAGDSTVSTGELALTLLDQLKGGSSPWK